MFASHHNITCLLLPQQGSGCLEVQLDRSNIFQHQVAVQVCAASCARLTVWESCKLHKLDLWASKDSIVTVMIEKTGLHLCCRRVTVCNNWCLGRPGFQGYQTATLCGCNSIGSAPCTCYPQHCSAVTHAAKSIIVSTSSITVRDLYIFCQTRQLVSNNLPAGV